VITIGGDTRILDRFLASPRGVYLRSLRIIHVYQYKGSKDLHLYYRLKPVAVGRLRNGHRWLSYGIDKSIRPIGV
jgi:hypothetical protein